eukprot:jgi/Botrbrau1/988/Bobra.114_1s0028.1
MPGLEPGKLASRRQAWKNILDDDEESSPGKMSSTKRILHAIVAGKSNGSVKLQDLQLSEVPALLYNGKSLPDEAEETAWWQEQDLIALDISHNSIVEIPEGLSALETLQKLDISNNKVKSLPEGLRCLTGLQSLNISANQLASLPTSLAALPELKTLDCSSNQLVSLPNDLGSICTSLVSLRAANNALAKIPNGLACCSYLTALVLENNKIETVPDALVQGLTSLVQLQLTKNSISGTMPKSLSVLKALKVLDARQNRITAIPPEIGSCTCLIEIYLGYNLLKSVPRELGQLAALQTLDLRDNQLVSLPGEICKLRLRLLDVSNNNLNVLPPELGTMTTLRSLPCSGNPLRGLRQAARGISTDALLAALRNRIAETGQGADEDITSPHPCTTPTALSASLRLKDTTPGSIASPLPGGCREVVLQRQRLDTVPSEVWEGSSVLTRLDLTANSIPSIQIEALQRCSLLRALQLGENKLVCWPLPRRDDSLPCLRTLDISKNPIESVPVSAFASCSRTLCCLNFSGVCAVSTAPKEIWQCLDALQELNVSSCTLHELPPLTFMTALRLLIAKRNKITALPGCIAMLEHLEELDVSDNDVGHVPHSLGFLPRLRCLLLEGNPIRSIRRPVLERGTAAVLEYLRSRAPALS